MRKSSLHVLGVRHRVHHPQTGKRDNREIRALNEALKTIHAPKRQRMGVELLPRLPPEANSPTSTHFFWNAAKIVRHHQWVPAPLESRTRLRISNRLHAIATTPPKDLPTAQIRQLKRIGDAFHRHYGKKITPRILLQLLATFDYARSLDMMRAARKKKMIGMVVGTLHAEHLHGTRATIVNASTTPLNPSPALKKTYMEYRLFLPALIRILKR